MSFMEEFDHLKIPLEDIILATNNFGPNNLIGRGGFGSVYKGELCLPEGQIMVACKRLDRNFGQGNVEFWKEIMMLSKCKHENLVSLLYFCIEGDERILVYEYASRGSLDRYISNTSLTWMQRLEICLKVARAINYLHDPMETQQRVLHRDIKSSNILLDENWNVKVSDFGLSKIGPANQPRTYIVSNAVGTLGYCDPLYGETGFLSKESDLYSFGVVLFEVMCGTLCCKYHNGDLVHILVHDWKKCFYENRLHEMICHGLQEQMESGSLKTFSAIAYRCLKQAREERPKMGEIIQELENALEQQELFEDRGKRANFEGMPKITDLVEPPLSYISQSNLLLLYTKGVLVDGGKTWFSLNKNEDHYEFISITKCMSTTIIHGANSRIGYFGKVELTYDLGLKVTTQFLSPNVTYIINLVYKCVSRPGLLRVPFKYKLEEMKQLSTSCVAYKGEDGWLRTQLFQFTSNKKDHCFNIRFSKASSTAIWDFHVEGLEFIPVDLEKSESGKNESESDMRQLDNINWEAKLPKDYTDLVKRLKHTKEWMSKKEIYFLLRRGILINNSQQWFSISKKSKKRYMLPARAILQEKSRWNILSRRKYWIWRSIPGSRFNVVAEACDINHLDIICEIKSQLLSLGTSYACYLVYRLPEKSSVFQDIVITSWKDSNTSYAYGYYIYLRTPPHVPIVELSTGPSRTRKIKGHPKLRKDGWMEMQVWEFETKDTPQTMSIEGRLRSLDEWNFTGLLVQGLEFRPLKASFGR